MKKINHSANILFFVTVLFWFSQYAYTSYVNPELEKMGATAVFMGIVSSAYGFTQLLLRIPVGIIADKWQKKFFICVGSLCAGLSSLCMLLFYHPAAFLIGRALGGVAASSWVTFTILYSSYSKPEEATKSITMINVANQLGRMLSFLLAGLFVTGFGPKAAFAVAATGGGAAFFLSLLVHEEGRIPGKKPVRIPELLAVAKDRNLLVTSILAVFVQVIAFSTYFGFTSNYAKLIGATDAQLSFMNVVLIAPATIVNFVVSKYILQHIEAKWLVFTGFLFTLGYCWILPSVTTIPHLYIMQMVAGIGNSLTLTLLMGLCVKDIGTDRRSAAMGFFQAIYGLGMTVGPILMGFLVDSFDLRAGFYFMAGIAAATAAVTLPLFRRKKKPA